jgi:hypothetical protein
MVIFEVGRWLKPFPLYLGALGNCLEARQQLGVAAVSQNDIRLLEERG